VATLHLHVQSGTPGGTIPITLTNANGSDAAPSFTIALTPVAGSIVVPSSIASAPTFSPRAFPSPWRSDVNSGLPITFDRLSGTSTIKVFSVSGRLVKQWSTTAASTGWNRDADSGGTVASGLYFYVITNSLGQKASGKLVIIQ